MFWKLIEFKNATLIDNQTIMAVIQHDGEVDISLDTNNGYNEFQFKIGLAKLEELVKILKESYFNMKDD